MANNIKILECTLRDGGYVNNWKFGKEQINIIIEQLEKTFADIIELGFLRDEVYSSDRAVFSNMKDVKEILWRGKKEKIKYAVFVGMDSPYQLQKLEEKDEMSADIIRYGFWARKLDEAYDYAKVLSKKGYELFIQPTRIEQYTLKTFKNMVKKFSQLSPAAIYIVDTFGLLSKDILEQYAITAHENMPQEIALGYHAHNNMQQAFANATYLAEMGLGRNLIIDCSTSGIGRGAGNLCTEIWISYLNSLKGSKYNKCPCYHIYDSCLKSIYENSRWGYSMPYLLTAEYGANPNWGTFFIKENYAVTKMEAILKSMPEENRIVFSEEYIRNNIYCMEEGK